MSRKGSHSAITMLRRHREVRDVFNKLKKTYSSATVQDFFERHYFLQMPTIYSMVKNSDREPVDLASCSIVYTHVMDPNFKL